MNPHTNIFVLFLSPSNHIRLKNWSQFQGVLDYKNVHLRYFHMEDIIRETAVEEFMSHDVIRNSKWKVLHTSDTLRYALLRKYSGVYLDLDVIVKRPINEIGLANFACLEEEDSVNNAIIKLSGDDSAKAIGDLLLK
jgi:lactosylceramide 4-alpha-galactosyltransferase